MSVRNYVIDSSLTTLNQKLWQCEVRGLLPKEMFLQFLNNDTFAKPNIYLFLYSVILRRFIGIAKNYTFLLNVYKFLRLNNPDRVLFENYVKLLKCNIWKDG